MSQDVKPSLALSRDAAASASGRHDARRGVGSGPWIGRIVNSVLVLALGVVLGIQYMAPDKRVLAVLAGLVVAGIAWRLEIIAGIGVAAIALPFPKGTTFGSTNLALILLLLVIYLLRVGQRELPRPSRSPLDAPIIGLFIAYIVSFYNLPPEALTQGIANFEIFVGTLLMFFVVVNSIRTESDLRRLHMFQVTSMVVIAIVALWELTHPGKAIVPGWIDFTETQGEAFNTRNVRIGGAFHDYELFADFCGLSLLFLSFLLARAKDAVRRAGFVALILLFFFLLFSTVTRGPLFSLMPALAYLVWVMRRRLRVVPVTLAVAAIASIAIGMNFVVSNFTRSGDLFARVSKTEFHGLVPDTRTTAWHDAWERFLQHPLIGTGPVYTWAKGLTNYFWPHDLYLYVANLVGIFGLTFFVLILVRLFQVTRPRVDSFTHGSYVESYLLLARAQLVFFVVDQTKIEYLRNPTYQYQVWLMFALWVAASRLRDDAAPARA
jgi:O-antigen ligase